MTRPSSDAVAHDRRRAAATTNSEYAIRRRYVDANGDHLMTPADESYVRRVFTPVPDEPDYTRSRILSLIQKGSLPLPSYVLTDGELMVHRDYLRPVREAGRPERLRAWFVAQWPADERDVARQEWKAYLSGQYVCLYVVTPTTIRAKTRIIEQIKSMTALLDRQPRAQQLVYDARATLERAVRALDELEAPMTEYDRARFGGPVSRDVWIEQVRHRYLT